MMPMKKAMVNNYKQYNNRLGDDEDFLVLKNPKMFGTMRVSKVEGGLPPLYPFGDSSTMTQ
jgi:hypothetical protein